MRQQPAQGAFLRRVGNPRRETLPTGDQHKLSGKSDSQFGSVDSKRGRIVSRNRENHFPGARNSGSWRARILVDRATRNVIFRERVEMWRKWKKCAATASKRPPRSKPKTANRLPPVCPNPKRILQTESGASTSFRLQKRFYFLTDGRRRLGSGWTLTCTALWAPSLGDGSRLSQLQGPAPSPEPGRIPRDSAGFRADSKPPTVRPPSVRTQKRFCRRKEVLVRLSVCKNVSGF